MADRTRERIQLMTVTGCPHRDLMLARLRQALDQAGAPDMLMTERVIDDPFTGPGTAGSVSCRLCATAAGFDGAPSVDELVDAVSDLTSDPS